MQILEIEKLFQSEETLAGVFDYCKECFDEVEYYAGIMKDGMVSDNPQEASEALGKLTGVYMTLNNIVAIAETEMRNREIRKYNEIRMNTESMNKKFVSASADQEASESVNAYRRVRNYVTAYRDDCEKGIITLQSILKQTTKEKIVSGKEE
jgi:hypothetical protein